MIAVTIKVEIGDSRVEVVTAVTVPSQAKDLVVATIAALVADAHPLSEAPDA